MNHRRSVQSCSRNALLAAVIAMACAAAAQGQLLSWNTGAANSANTGQGSGVTGTEFTLAAAATATHLGYCDDTFVSPEGLTSAHLVGIYDAATQALIAQATVPAGTAAVRVGAFRVVPLAAPVALEAGRLYIAVGTDTGGDPTRNVSVAGGTLIPAPNPPGVTIGRWVAALNGAGPPTLAFPTFEFSTTTTRLGPVVGLSFDLVGIPGWGVQPEQHATTGPGSQSEGLEFSVTRPIDITGLSVYDDTYISPPGLYVSHPVAIFDAVSRTQLAFAVVPAGNTTPLAGEHRGVPITPLRLMPNRRYVAVTVIDTDPSRVLARTSIQFAQGVRLHAWRLGPTGTSVQFSTSVITATANFGVSAGILVRERCSVDFDASGGATTQDIFDFLAAWFAAPTFGVPASAAGDFNRDGLFNTQDIFDFLAAWFAGCL
jgi:hypothetical protein